MLTWFTWTHTLGDTGWVRTTLPSAGGIDQQDAWLMAALEWTRRVCNAIESDRRKERDREDRTRAWRDKRVAAARR